uniref:MATH domain-containing protein n=1 Tax=Oryza punctata TaxID=4537 RepID=A0A0E0LEH2_ORYPU
MSSIAWNLTEAISAVHDFKVNGYSATKAGRDGDFRSNRLTVGGYEWEIHYNPVLGNYRIAFKVVFLGPVRSGSVRASFRCRLMQYSTSHWCDINGNKHEIYSTAYWRDASGSKHECKEETVSHNFMFSEESSRWVGLMKHSDLESNSSILADDSFRVRCVIAVLKDQQ